MVGADDNPVLCGPCTITAYETRERVRWSAMKRCHVHFVASATHRAGALEAIALHPRLGDLAAQRHQFGRISD